MKNLVEIHGIPSDHIDEVWPLAATFLQKALDATPAGKCYQVEDIKVYLDKATMQLWLITIAGEIVAAAVTQIIIYPRCRILDVLFMGGALYDDWSGDFNDLMRKYGKSQHCEYARGYGRLGWARKVKHLGINPSIYFDLPLSEESNETIH